MRSYLLSAILGLGLSSLAQSAAVCHHYILKIAAELDSCGNNLSCLEAPFKQAMNYQTSGDKYMVCKNSFDAEISDRINLKKPAAVVDLNVYKGLLSPTEFKKMVQFHQSFKYQPQLSAQNSCSEAHYFLTYASKPCHNAQCVDKQYQSTIKIPSYASCASVLVSAREARKAALPNSKVVSTYKYTPAAGKIVQAGK